VPTPSACTTRRSPRRCRCFAVWVWSAEINSGGFLPAPHLPIEPLRASQDAREEYLGLSWHSVFLDARDYQWQELAIPYWKDIQARARDADVKVCIEMHPHNLVYNPATMERLVTEVNATHVGAEMDPSHLFWQGIDPIAALDRLGGLVYNAAAKDTRINPAVKVNGVLDDRFGRVHPDEPGAVSLGGRYTLSRWPEDSSWDFVAVGRGHDVAFWSKFLRALHKIDPDMAVNIEHEDQELDQMEGLRRAAETLLEAAGRS
jgi:sugar phosphate isomerase/epimerase